MATTRVVNLRRDAYDIYIGRGSRWGNPYTHLPLSGTKAEFQVASREEAVEKYLEWFIDCLHTVKDFKEETLKLKGKVLGCYCKPESCHGDLIAHWLDYDPYEVEEEDGESNK